MHLHILTVRFFIRNLPHSQWQPHPLGPWLFQSASQLEVDSTKAPSDVTLIERSSREVFVMLVVFVHSFFIFVIYLLLFFIQFSSLSFFIFQATLPYHRHSTVDSQAREGLHQL